MRDLRWLVVVSSISLVTFLAAQSETRLTALGQAGQAGALAGTGVADGPGVIEGVVLRPDTKEPIANAEVAITGGQVRTTDASGRFEFRDLTLNAYTVSAERDGFFPAVPRMFARGRGATAVSRTIVLTPQQPRGSFVIELLPAAALSGRVLDSNNRPASGIQVEALVPSYQAGRGALQPAQTQGTAQAQTDDRGEYRLWGLAPGNYYLRANAEGRGARRGPANDSYAVTYFPSVHDYSLTSPLRLIPGNESIRDIRLLPVNPIPLRVQVTSTDPIAAVNTSQFFLIPKDWPAADLSEIQVRATRAASGWQIQVPRPGTYELVAVTRTTDQPVPTAGVPVVYYSGRLDVSIRESASDIVTIAVVRMYSLDVRYNTDADPTSGNSIVGLSLVPNEPLTPSLLLPALRNARGARAGAAADPLSFSPILQGQYVLESSLGTLLLTTPVGVGRGSRGNGYISDIRYEGKSILEDGIITVDRPPTEGIEIVLAQGGGIIQGSVRNAQGGSVTAADVILIPEGNRRQNSLLYRRLSVVEAAQGAFTFAGITPGLYKVFAWESVPVGAERNAEFLRPFENYGRSVTVSAGATVTGLSVPLIPFAQ